MGREDAQHRHEPCRRSREEERLPGQGHTFRVHGRAAGRRRKAGPRLGQEVASRAVD